MSKKDCAGAKDKQVLIEKIVSLLQKLDLKQLTYIYNIIIRL